MTTSEVVVVGKTCGETFELVRFHGAGAGCGVRERVRFTCGQDFARTAGSGKRFKPKVLYQTSFFPKINL